MGRNSKGKISSPHFIFGRLFCLVSDLTLLRFPDTEENASQTQRSWTSRKLVIGPPFFEYFPSMCRDSLMYTLKFPLVEEGVA